MLGQAGNTSPFTNNSGVQGMFRFAAKVLDEDWLSRFVVSKHLLISLLDRVHHLLAFGGWTNTKNEMHWTKTLVMNMMTWIFVMNIFFIHWELIELVVLEAEISDGPLRSLMAGRARFLHAERKGVLGWERWQPNQYPKKTPEKNGWKKNGTNTLYKETWLWILFSSSAEAKLEHVETETKTGWRRRQCLDM